MHSIGENNGKQVVFDPTERTVRYRFGASETVDNGGGAHPAHGGHVETKHETIGRLVLHFSIQETGFDGDESIGKLLWERDTSGEHRLRRYGSGNDRQIARQAMSYANGQL